MKLMEKYEISLFREGESNHVSNYTVRMKSLGEKTIRINAEVLLLATPGCEICDVKGRKLISMITLDQAILFENEWNQYDGFHEVREVVRAILRRKGLNREIEFINRKVAIPEFKAYMDMSIGERAAFSLYYKERFPKSSKQRFGYNIGYMFEAYQREVVKEDVPKTKTIYYVQEFRTKLNRYGEYQAYPINIPYERQEATYRAKVAICTLYELRVA